MCRRRVEVEREGMSARELPIDPGFRVPGQRPSARRGLAYLLIGLTILAAACQSTPKATQQWTPPYLEMHLYAGKAKVQWSECRPELAGSGMVCSWQRMWM